MALNLRVGMQVMMMMMISADVRAQVPAAALASASVLPPKVWSPVRAAKAYSMTLYVHVNLTAGPDKGEAKVAGVNGTNSDGMSFGTIIAVAGLVTEGSTANTTSVGRLQGIYANVALAGNNYLLPVSFIFHNRQFNGSTIQILGANRQDLTVRTVSIVGGTGVFGFATGTADISLYYIDPSSMYTLKFHLKFYTLFF